MIRKLFFVIVIFLFSVVNSIAEEKVICGINLFFTHDDHGPTAEYHLTTQITNRSGRSVSGVATFFYNKDGALIGNAELDCDIARPPLQPGSTGQCSALLQTIDGKMMEKFGTSMWTEIVNVQLERLISITHCQVEGYRYITE